MDITWKVCTKHKNNNRRRPLKGVNVQTASKRTKSEAERVEHRFMEKKEKMNAFIKNIDSTKTVEDIDELIDQCEDKVVLKKLEKIKEDYKEGQKILGAALMKRQKVRSMANHLERASINTPLQGGAADIMVACMLKVHRSTKLKELGWKQILQIHDEIILEGPQETANEVCI